jgi:hypothetical protein
VNVVCDWLTYSLAVAHPNLEKVPELSWTVPGQRHIIRDIDVTQAGGLCGGVWSRALKPETAKTDMSIRVIADFAQ